MLDADAVMMYEETHSVRKTAKAYGVDHKTMSRFLKSQGVEVLGRAEAAKYTWTNNVHPRLGKKGAECPAYGHKMTEETREKMRPIWAANGDKKRLIRKYHSGGYVLVYAPNHPNADRNGYVLEHRLVMEGLLGRILSAEEYVHHINEDKRDNRPENLMLTNKIEHAKIHMEMRYKNDAE